MKHLSIFLFIALGNLFISPLADAKGERFQRGGGGAQAAQPRNPMTGSKIQRPTVRPMPRPVARPQVRPQTRPQSRPQTRPEARPQLRPRPEVRPRPEARPTPRPEIRPTPRPEIRPPARPSVQRPSVERPMKPRPDERPNLQRPNVQRPEIARPSQRPSIDRPQLNRPSTLPGMVTYPNKPERPMIRPSTDRKRPQLQRPSTLPARQKPNWDNKPWGGNHGIWGNNNNININIDNRYKHNHNFSYRPNYWGARPWWGASDYHHWHHGHWGYGWNSHYYRRHWYYRDDDFASGFMWGITVWSLGNLVYDMGYHSYRNPYPAPPVQNTYITYAEPVSVAAAANPPGDEKNIELAETNSREAFERSRTAFKKADYLAASKAVDEALAHTPDDTTLHEYRALVFFALGKYAEAAGVLNSVLASGPGWGWSTMVEFYGDSAKYSDQLSKLEAYVKSAPEKADAKFLLGYHYMVCGHLDQAYREFAKAAELEPADSISRQLRDLTADSLPDAESSEEEPPSQPAPIDPETLVGTWVSDLGNDGKVTFTMTEGGHYTWNYKSGEQTNEIIGDYSIDEKGLLVLSNDDSQMVASIEEDKGKGMHFVLVGAPEGDPGLDFTKY